MLNKLVGGSFSWKKASEMYLLETFVILTSVKVTRQFITSGTGWKLWDAFNRI